MATVAAEAAMEAQVEVATAMAGVAAETVG